ncbi:MAG: acetolactate decarboxylase [Syntrophobacteraceae bacterium]|jgi:acetolactate decarboxylase
MLRKFACLVLMFALLLPCGFDASAQQQKKLTQFSTIDALMSGIYDGTLTMAELTRYGDFGLGTFQSLDGEMAVVDGIVYQITSDGAVHTPDAAMTTPFAAVTFFAPDREIELKSGATFESLAGEVDPLLPTRNIFYAVRIEGLFDKVKTRVVPKQCKPYPPLTEVVKTQSTFDFEKVEGVMVGWRCPSFVKGINFPGYHLHFLTKDRKAGGHVLEFTAGQATVKIDGVSDFRVILPESKDFFGLNLEGGAAASYDAVEKK